MSIIPRSNDLKNDALLPYISKKTVDWISQYIYPSWISLNIPSFTFILRSRMAFCIPSVDENSLMDSACMKWQFQLSKKARVPFPFFFGVPVYIKEEIIYFWMKFFWRLINPNKQHEYMYNYQKNERNYIKNV